MTDQSDTEQDERPIDRRSAHVGIVCTHKLEIAPLLSRIDRLRKYKDHGAIYRGGFIDETIRVAVVEAGAGFARHRQAALTLIAEHSPAWVLSVGFSSPLSDELKQGDLCLASEICDTHGNFQPVKCVIPESKRVLVRKHVVTDSHPLTQNERSHLHSANDAIAVDTTSLAVAQACAVKNESARATRFLSLRGIVGNADQDLSDRIIEYLFQPDPDKKTSLLGKLKSRFRKDPDLQPWDEVARQTAKNLSRFTLGVVKQLAE